MWRRTVSAVVLLIAGLGVPGMRADELHVIELRHRPAAELRPLIQPLLRTHEGISGSGYRLYLRASTARRNEVERLIASLDVAAPQLTVTVRQALARDRREARDAVSGDVEIGGRGRVIVPDDAAGGSAIGGARGRSGLRYRFERRSTTGETAHTQVLRVRDGERAFIRIGRSAAAVERVLVLTGRRAAVRATGMRVEDFTTGFDVLPRVRGATVQLEIVPRLVMAGGDSGTFSFQELHTTVTARRGEWIDLGLLAARSSEVNAVILQSARAHSAERTTILLKVE